MATYTKIDTPKLNTSNALVLVRSEKGDGLCTNLCPSIDSNTGVITAYINGNAIYTSDKLGIDLSVKVVDKSIKLEASKHEDSDIKVGIDTISLTVTTAGDKANGILSGTCTYNIHVVVSPVEQAFCSSEVNSIDISGLERKFDIRENNRVLTSDIVDPYDDTVIYRKDDTEPFKYTPNIPGVLTYTLEVDYTSECPTGSSRTEVPGALVIKDTRKYNPGDWVVCVDNGNVQPISTDYHIHNVTDDEHNKVFVENPGNAYKLTLGSPSLGADNYSTAEVTTTDSSGNRHTYKVKRVSEGFYTETECEYKEGDTCSCPYEECCHVTEFTIYNDIWALYHNGTEISRAESVYTSPNTIPSSGWDNACITGDASIEYMGDLYTYISSLDRVVYTKDNDSCVRTVNGQLKYFLKKDMSTKHFWGESITDQGKGPSVLTYDTVTNLYAEGVVTRPITEKGLYGVYPITATGMLCHPMIKTPYDQGVSIDGKGVGAGKGTGATTIGLAIADAFGKKSGVRGADLHDYAYFYVDRPRPTSLIPAYINNDSKYTYPRLTINGINNIAGPATYLVYEHISKSVGKPDKCQNIISTPQIADEDIYEGLNKSGMISSSDHATVRVNHAFGNMASNSYSMDLNMAYFIQDKPHMLFSYAPMFDSSVHSSDTSTDLIIQAYNGSSTFKTVYVNNIVPYAVFFDDVLYVSGVSNSNIINADEYIPNDLPDTADSNSTASRTLRTYTAVIMPGVFDNFACESPSSDGIINKTLIQPPKSNSSTISTMEDTYKRAVIAFIADYKYSEGAWATDKTHYKLRISDSSYSISGITSVDKSKLSKKVHIKATSTRIENGPINGISSTTSYASNLTYDAVFSIGSGGYTITEESYTLAKPSDYSYSDSKLSYAVEIVGINNSINEAYNGLRDIGVAPTIQDYSYPSLAIAYQIGYVNATPYHIWDYKQDGVGELVYPHGGFPYDYSYSKSNSDSKVSSVVSSETGISYKLGELLSLYFPSSGAGSYTHNLSYSGPEVPMSINTDVKWDISFTAIGENGGDNNPIDLNPPRIDYSSSFNMALGSDSYSSDTSHANSSQIFGAIFPFEAPNRKDQKYRDIASMPTAGIYVKSGDICYDLNVSARYSYTEYKNTSNNTSTSNNIKASGSDSGSWSSVVSSDGIELEDNVTPNKVSFGYPENIIMSVEDTSPSVPAPSVDVMSADIVVKYVEILEQENSTTITNYTTIFWTHRTAYGSGYEPKEISQSQDKYTIWRSDYVYDTAKTMITLEHKQLQHKTYSACMSEAQTLYAKYKEKVSGISNDSMAEGVNLNTSRAYIFTYVFGDQDTPAGLDVIITITTDTVPYKFSFWNHNKSYDIFENNYKFILTSQSIGVDE